MKVFLYISILFDCRDDDKRDNLQSKRSFSSVIVGALRALLHHQVL